jgi:hypothetical protein
MTMSTEHVQPLFSAVIPTIGRSTVERAVESVLEQRFDHGDFEVVVVNDSGQTLPPAEWQRSPQVRIVTTQRRERCVARNTGAAIARGQYLCFLDDDDTLLPNAFAEFWKLACQDPDAGWLYGGIRVVDDTGACLAEVNSRLSGNCLAQIMGGAWVPIQTSAIRSDAFFLAGGFDTSIIGTEDLDLCRRIALRHRFASTPAAVACLLRGSGWSTSTDYLRAPEDTRVSRDSVLAEGGALSLLLESAASPYWLGRTFHVYLSTALWNVRRRRVTKGISRALHGLAVLGWAGRQSFTREFRAAVGADHVPHSLHFIVQALERTTGSGHPHEPAGDTRTRARPS